MASKSSRPSSAHSPQSVRVRQAAGSRDAVDGDFPPGEARPDFDIFLALAEKLGIREELYPSWKSPHDAYMEWQQVSAGRMCDYSNFSWQQIDDANGLQWGGESLYRDGIFRTADGRAILHNVPCDPFKEQPDTDYSFILNTGRTVEHWHTRTKTAEVDLLNNMVPNAWLEMNPLDATNLDLKPRDRVTVRSRRGAVADLELRITGIVAPAQVFMPFHFAETNSNIVTLGDYDPISRELVVGGSLTRIQTEITLRGLPIDTYFRNRYSDTIIPRWRKTPNIATFSPAHSRS